MSDSSYIIQQSRTLNFFQKLKYRFRYGDTPSDNNGFICLGNPRLTNLDFDSHPGPLQAAFEDACNLQKRLLIYIYFIDNEICQKFEELFKDQLIANTIRQNWIFYPVSITSIDGIELASKHNFKQLPIVRIYTPDIHHRNIMSSHNSSSSGNISRSLFLELIGANEEISDASSMSQDHHENEAQPPVEENQVENEIEENHTEDQHETEKKLIEEAYEKLPQPQENEECYTIKFRFPNNTERIKVFPANGTIKLIFIFVRYFTYPEEFTLKYGFPAKDIIESDDPIETIADGRYFAIFVYNVDD